MERRPQGHDHQQKQPVPSQGINSLATIIKRLEAATSRLEDIALASSQGQAINESLAPETSTSAEVSGDTTQSGILKAAETPVSLPPVLQAYDQMLATTVTPYLTLSNDIGGFVKEQSFGVQKLFSAQRDFISIVIQSKKPNPDTFVELLKPTSSAMETVSMIRENNRSSEYFNHLSTVSEGVPALGWVAIEPKPVTHIGETKESSRFYGNRVLKEWKDKDRKHVDWVNAFLGILTQLEDYVKTHFTTGLIWNANGKDAKSVQPLPSSLKSTSVSSSIQERRSSSMRGSAAPAPPPPPPPPPLPSADLADRALAAAGASSKPVSDMTGVFAELNKGELITSHLRKVDPSQQTHKNPQLRASGVVSDDGNKSFKSSPPSRPTKPSKLQVKKPKMALDGNKWTIEHYENDNNIVIEHTEINQTVYIFGLKNSMVQVKGKVNTIILDSSSKTGLLVESVVSTVELLNCKSVQLQVTGIVPTVSIDKTDGAQIYLSKACIPPVGNVEILTAKASAVNVSVPTGEGGDFEERPVPEQFKSVVAPDGKLTTTVVELAG